MRVRVAPWQPPPGYYMLSAISQDGVYSEASVVRIGA